MGIRTSWVTSGPKPVSKMCVKLSKTAKHGLLELLTVNEQQLQDYSEGGVISS